VQAIDLPNTVELSCDLPQEAVEKLDFAPFSVTVW